MDYEAQVGEHQPLEGRHAQEIRCLRHPADLLGAQSHHEVLVLLPYLNEQAGLHHVPLLQLQPVAARDRQE